MAKKLWPCFKANEYNEVGVVYMTIKLIVYILCYVSTGSFIAIEVNESVVLSPEENSQFLLCTVTYESSASLNASMPEVTWNLLNGGVSVTDQIFSVDEREAIVQLNFDAVNSQFCNLNFTCSATDNNIAFPITRNSTVSVTISELSV